MSADIPRLDGLPRAPKRIVVHWTAGGPRPTPEEKLRYHYLIDQENEVHAGVLVERNLRDLKGVSPAHRDAERGYAAHTRGFNTDSVGISLCGMAGAVDRRPEGSVEPGPVPIKQKQVEALFSFLVACVASWELPVAESTLFTHYEAEAVHGIDQFPAGPKIWRWDVTWIPGLNLSRGEAGPWIRQQIHNWRLGQQVRW